MLNNENLFIQTKDEIEKLWSNNKKLSNFVKWPKNLALKEKTTHKINVTEKLSIWKSSGDHQIDKIHNLISNLAPNVNWNNGYSEDQTKVISEPVKLEQNYRNFDYESPWEGTKYIKEEIDNNDKKN